MFWPLCAECVSGAVSLCFGCFSTVWHMHDGTLDHHFKQLYMSKSYSAAGLLLDLVKVVTNRHPRMRGNWFGFSGTKQKPPRFLFLNKQTNNNTFCPVSMREKLSKEIKTGTTL